jgi:hypothetical protein
MKARAAGLLAAAFAFGGCGYSLMARGAPLPGGEAAIFVPPLENRTSDAELGAWIAAALREDLARRGRGGEPDSALRLEGEVLESGFSPASSGATTYRAWVILHARLKQGDQVLAETTLRSDDDYLGGLDALESEGRRRVALRRLSEKMARELLERFEAY